MCPHWKILYWHERGIAGHARKQIGYSVRPDLSVSWSKSCVLRGRMCRCVLCMACLRSHMFVPEWAVNSLHVVSASPVTMPHTNATQSRTAHTRPRIWPLPSQQAGTGAMGQGKEQGCVAGSPHNVQRIPSSREPRPQHTNKFPVPGPCRSVGAPASTVLQRH